MHTDTYTQICNTHAHRHPFPPNLRAIISLNHVVFHKKTCCFSHSYLQCHLGKQCWCPVSWHLHPAWEFMKSEGRGKTRCPHRRVIILGSETRVRAPNTRALLTSWHRVSGDWSFSFVSTSVTSRFYFMGMVEESEFPSTELLEYSIQFNTERSQSSRVTLCAFQRMRKLKLSYSELQGHDWDLLVILFIYLFVTLDLCGLRQVSVSKSSSVIL